jgi:hypothetical protein
MPTYIITIEVTGTETASVEADTPEEAWEKYGKGDADVLSLEVWPEDEYSIREQVEEDI